MVLSSNFHEGH
jgi:hypothetical protein